MIPRYHNEDRLDAIDKKLDLIISLIKDGNGLKGFGINVLANVVGNMIDGKK